MYKKTEYNSPFLLLRAPRLPFKKITEFYQMLVNNPDRLEMIFSFFLEDEGLLEALYVASSNLHGKLTKYARQPDKYVGEERQKLMISLLKYLARMSARSTPYGLFASCGIIDLHNVDNDAEISDLSQPYIKLADNLLPHRRLDMDCLNKISYQVENAPLLRGHLLYYTNSSIYKIHDTWRYVEIKYQSGVRKYDLVDVEDNSVLSRIIKMGKNGVYIHDLVAMVMELGYDKEESIAYLEEIIESKILINELYPNVSGPEFEKIFFEKVDGLKQAPYDFSSIAAIHSSMESLKTADVVDVKAYQEVVGQVTTLDEQIQEGKVFQVDLMRDIEQHRLPKELADEILDAVHVMMAISPESNENDKLEKFRGLFYERFEEMPVPLALALDPDVGIDFKNLRSYTASGSDSGDGKIYWGMSTNIKFSLFKQSIKDDLYEVVIDDKSLEKLDFESIKLPQSFSFMGSILSDADNPDKLKILTTGCVGPSAANLIGRFCHADESLGKKVKDLAEAEESLDKHKVYAEIAHLPQGRIGNILSRPHLRQYEIQYLGGSTMEKENQIHVDDLFLKYEGGQLNLYSKKLKKQIIPRLSSAHNFYAIDNLPMYQFLCSLQNQNLKGRYIAWSWEFLSNQAFLPRVSYKQIILSPATWNVNSNRFLVLKKLNDEDCLKEATNIKKALKLPDLIYIAEADNLLLVDLRTIAGIRILISESKKRESVKLQECLFSDDELIVRNEEGGFTNEIVVPFVESKPIDQADTGSQSVRTNKTIKRKHAPGGEWIYLKVYSGVKSIESILCDVLRPLMDRLHKKQHIEKWFFLRYGDPDFHLRIRLKLSDKKHFGDVMDQIHKKLKSLIENDIIWRVQLDTYKPEIERYGATTMELSETLFFL
ncbi:MAG: lantibiotic dehydratase [Bacteroidota bacterium]